MPLQDLVIGWDEVTQTVAGGPVDITGYEVIVTKEHHDDPNGFSRPIYDVHVPPNVTSLGVPAEFLEAETVYELEVLALEVSGNQTITVGFFKTVVDLASARGGWGSPVREREARVADTRGPVGHPTPSRAHWCHRLSERSVTGCGSVCHRARVSRPVGGTYPEIQPHEHGMLDVGDGDLAVLGGVREPARQARGRAARRSGLGLHVVAAPAVRPGGVPDRPVRPAELRPEHPARERTRHRPVEQHHAEPRSRTSSGYASTSASSAGW